MLWVPGTLVAQKSVSSYHLYGDLQQMMWNWVYFVKINKMPKTYLYKLYNMYTLTTNVCSSFEFMCCKTLNLEDVDLMSKCFKDLYKKCV